MITSSEHKRWYKSWWKLLLLVFTILIVTLIGRFVYQVTYYYKKISTGAMIPIPQTRISRGRLIAPPNANANRALNIKGSFTFGSPNTATQIIEFGDLECPYSKEFASTIRSLMVQRPNDFYYVFRDFPLTDTHRYAFRASLALNCANDQNKFLPMHDKIFANQEKLGDQDLTRYATQVGVNMETFTKCFTEQKYKNKINQDIADGTAAGVTGTPTLFINGRKIEGALPKQYLEQFINQ